MAPHKIVHGQRKRIFSLLKDTNLENQRSNIVAGFCPSGSMQDMTYSQAKEMIIYLEGKINQERDEKARKRRKIIHICYLLPESLEFWYWQMDKQKFNAKGLDNWLLNSEKSPFKKRLNDMGSSELSKLITVFDKMRRFYND